jgi:hypothetical protein
MILGAKAVTAVCLAEAALADRAHLGTQVKQAEAEAALVVLILHTRLLAVVVVERMLKLILLHP